MKYHPIDRNLFIENRANFVKHLKPKSIAIFNSNDIMPTNADGTMAFRQNNDLFFLSGVDQEESILVIFPDAGDGNHRMSHSFPLGPLNSFSIAAGFSCRLRHNAGSITPIA